jgi:simple sugar transport system ATP-binding protein
MDEPTSVLTPQEVGILFQTLRKLSSEGTAILYISHKLEEIRSLCHAATVLRRGRVVASCDPKEKSARALAELMVGAVLTPPARVGRAPGAVALQVEGLSVASPNPFGTALRDVSFTLRQGEILGIAGVAGNGQDELLAALSGELRSPAASVRIGGIDAGRLGPVARRRLGLVAAPEERLGHAAVPEMSLVENAVLSGWQRRGLARGGFIDWKKARAFAAEVVKGFDVRTPGTHVAARALSGGNLQKFVIGRELGQAPEVIVVNQPTWGVDASAAAAVRQALLDCAAAGAAVVAISQDLDELLEISDRFAALNEGRLSAPRPAEGLTVEEIGLMMGGAHGMEVAHVGG